MSAGRQHRLSALVALALVLAASIAYADEAPLDGLVLVEPLGSSDRRAVEAAVDAIEHAPAQTTDLADALFAAARTCEDTLVDPARALALYDRIVRELPGARVWSAARRRASVLRAQLGSGGQHARDAMALAQLVAGANELAPDELVRRADELANAAWPGAPDAALWLAEWLRRTGRLDEAQARYAAVTTRWPDTPQAIAALRSGAGCALERHDWDRAEMLATRFPSVEPADRILRDDLLEAAARGRTRDRWYLIAWLAIAGALAALAGSLVEAALRGGRWRPSLRPPIEVLFLAPVGAVLVGVAFTAHPLIAPAVTTIVIGGLVLAWLSGAGLDVLRARGRVVRGRAILHVVACLIAVGALAYIVLTRGNLLDQVIETARFGPDP
ncbi:MAG: hypothetical protein H6Q90_5321 [Deltaproteobacteria bacterium]|nr:hypothetical protein [Deltaproteobacteria bacterium]